MIVSAANDSTHDPDHAVQSGWFGFLLNQAAMRIRVATAEALASFGITPPQLRVLEAIDEAAPVSQARLGEMTAMDRTTMVHIIDRFESLGLAERKAIPKDRRSHGVMLTRKGRRVLAASRSRAQACQDEFLAPLSEQEKETFRGLLGRLIEPVNCPEENEDESRASPTHSR